MKKPFGKLAAVITAAVIASSSLAASSSALSLCFGGRCIMLTMPADLSLYLQRYYAANANDCTKTGSCGNTQSGGTDAAPSVPTGGGSASVSSEVSDVFELVNKARSENGLTELTLDKSLCAAAEIRAKEIVSSFSHTRPDGTSCFTVLKESGIGYRAAGENIAYGQRSASAVMNAWMNSSGHRANILGKSFGKVGIACFISGSTRYWVQMFTN